MAFDVPTITTAEVKQIADLQADDLSPYIANSVLFVTEILGASGLSDFLLRQIAVLLAAHFAFLREGQAKSETIGPAQMTYTIESGKGLLATVQGQQAVNLDTTGTLWALCNRTQDSVKPKKAFFEVY